MASAKRPTLRDVAREAGVSHMTVSRVVRGTRAVARATAERVRASIARTGYQPDPALSALAAYRTQAGSRGGGGGALAFLDCDGTEFSRSVLEGVRAEALLHGYGVACHRLPVGESGQRRLGRMLFHRGVRGLCFGPSDEERDFLGWNWQEFAAVSLGALAHRPALHAVAMDYFDGAFTACRALLARGCRRVGFAVEPGLEARTGHRWLGGYAAALAGGRLFVYGGRAPAKEEFAAWRRREKIDGLLTIHAELLRDWRPQPQENVYLLNDITGPTPAGLTRFSLDPRRIGAEGVRFLHHLLLRREYGLPAEPRMVALRGSWVEAACAESPSRGLL